MKITDILKTEHAVFCAMFDQIERALPDLTTPAEIQSLARLTASLLHGHGETEQNLPYTALDHMLKEKGHLVRLFSDHREMDARMGLVLKASDLVKARQLFQAAMVMSREHFRYEEQTVFPLVEKLLQNDSLEKLGDVWNQKHTALKR